MSWYGHNPLEGHECISCEERIPCTAENGYCDAIDQCEDCIIKGGAT